VGDTSLTAYGPLKAKLGAKLEAPSSRRQTRGQESGNSRTNAVARSRRTAALRTSRTSIGHLRQLLGNPVGIPVDGRPVPEVAEPAAHQSERHAAAAAKGSLRDDAGEQPVRLHRQILRERLFDLAAFQ
jgi:hypothetical protein